MVAEPIKVQGLAEFSRRLRAVRADLPKALRLALNGAADVVVREARPEVPVRTGRAARSIKAQSTRTAVRVAAGSARVPYYPWLDFGGRVGRKRSVARPFLKDGRYLYKGFFRKRDDIQDVLRRALIDVAESAGIHVDA